MAVLGEGSINQFLAVAESAFAEVADEISVMCGKG